MSFQARRPRGPSAARIHLAPPVRRRLQVLVRGAKTPFREAIRARIVLLAAEGLPNEHIAKRLSVSVDTVRLWRNRFAVDGRVESLQDRHRSGRPPTIPASVRCSALKLACARPADSKAPFRDVWSLGSLVEALEGETGYRLSRSEISRILRAEEIRPHRLRMWLHSPDPDFQSKVERICRLYLSPPPGATVLCVDEKTGIQALGRRHPTRYPSSGQQGRFEFEYVRNGTRSLIASFEPATGKVFGQVRERRTAEDLSAFMEALAQRYSRGDIYIIWDNLNIHHGPAWETFTRRHGGRFHFVHTPIHASWVNQIEIWFGILHRRILRYGIFSSPEQLVERILSFIAHWNAVEAHPFRWNFRGTRQGDRIRRHSLVAQGSRCQSSTQPKQTLTASAAF